MADDMQLRVRKLLSDIKRWEQRLFIGVTVLLGLVVLWKAYNLVLK